MDCIFNELSAQPVGTVAEAWEVMSHFVTAVRTAQQIGLSRVRIPEKLGPNLFLLPLAPNYVMGAWLNDERVDSDLRNRFRTITANPPLLLANEIEAMTVFEQSSFCLTEPAGMPEASGFGAAYLSGNLLLSFLTNPQWDTQTLSGWHWYVDDAGLEQTKAITVLHFATKAHFDLHKPVIQQQQRQQIERSIAVWEQREQFFPHLILCGDVKRQLKNIGESSSYLNQIIDRLRTLDAFAANWRTGDFNLDQLNAQTNVRASGESDLTMRLYSGQRRFKLPDGERKLFGMHIKTGSFRFHFYADNSKKKVYVGYIGPHLPTATG